MKQTLRAVILVSAAAALAGCGGESSPSPPPLPPEEAFAWGGQPISFSPPPPPWRREKEQSGGLKGARFVKERSVGERIHIAEHFTVGDRDRCAKLTEMRRDFDNFDKTSFLRAIQHARLYAPTPFSRQEEQLVEVVNYTLDRAGTFYRKGSLMAARQELDKAQEQAGRIRYSLDDVVDRVVFKAEKQGRFAPAFDVAEPRDTVLAGEPAVAVDYTMQHDGRIYHGREVYVMRNNHLFVASFHGLEENLPLFESILATVSFPPGECRH